jgi:Kef-type K+ transport system membrane component KefB
VLSSVYIIAALALLVVGGGGFHSNTVWVALCIIGFCIMSIAIGWLPMKLAMNQLKEFEAF